MTRSSISHTHCRFWMKQSTQINLTRSNVPMSTLSVWFCGKLGDGATLATSTMNTNCRSTMLCNRIQPLRRWERYAHRSNAIEWISKTLFAGGLLGQTTAQHTEQMVWRVRRTAQFIQSNERMLVPESSRPTNCSQDKKDFGQHQLGWQENLNACKLNGFSVAFYCFN